MIEMIIIFAQVTASSFFLLLRYLKRETITLSARSIKLTHNLDFIDAVGIVATYFKSVFAPFFTTVFIFCFFDMNTESANKLNNTFFLL